MTLRARAIGAVSCVMGALVARKDRLPRVLRRAIDDVSANPDGFAGRLSARLLGGRGRDIPTASRVPTTELRVYIGPTNYAGQGYRWARALEAEEPRIGAVNMAIELPGTFSFPADSPVPFAVNTASRAWHTAEFDSVTQFSHVLFEAQRPLFGPLFGRDVMGEIDALSGAGVSCALLAHGTDVRDPRRHGEREPHSPFADDPRTPRLQAEVERSLDVIDRSGLPVFVSTPDLLFDVPRAHWCPVVVDVDSWKAGRELFSRAIPVVVHVPSMGVVKGTRMIEEPMRRLHDEGLIEYRHLSAITSSRMPAVIGDADIVLDQFRLGSYGVGAVEAMSAGRVVVGHVRDEVRHAVEAAVGRVLPIVQGDPDDIEAVLRLLLGDPDAARRVGDEGAAFAREVHSGSRSARVLLDNWIL